MVDMLKTWMRRNMRRNHRGILVSILHFIGGGRRLILLVLVVALSTKIFRSFVLVRWSELRRVSRASTRKQDTGKGAYILIASQRLIHIT